MSEKRKYLLQTGLPGFGVSGNIGVRGSDGKNITIGRLEDFTTNLYISEDLVSVGDTIYIIEPDGVYYLVITEEVLKKPITEIRDDIHRDKQVNKYVFSQTEKDESYNYNKVRVVDFGKDSYYRAEYDHSIITDETSILNHIYGWQDSSMYMAYSHIFRQSIGLYNNKIAQLWYDRSKFTHDDAISEPMAEIEHNHLISEITKHERSRKEHLLNLVERRFGKKSYAELYIHNNSTDWDATFSLNDKQSHDFTDYVTVENDMETKSLSMRMVDGGAVVDTPRTNLIGSPNPTDQVPFSNRYITDLYSVYSPFVLRGYDKSKKKHIPITFSNLNIRRGILTNIPSTDMRFMEDIYLSDKIIDLENSFRVDNKLQVTIKGGMDEFFGTYVYSKLIDDHVVGSWGFDLVVGDKNEFSEVRSFVFPPKHTLMHHIVNEFTDMEHPTLDLRFVIQPFIVVDNIRRYVNGAIFNIEYLISERKFTIDVRYPYEAHTKATEQPNVFTNENAESGLNLISYTPMGADGGHGMLYIHNTGIDINTSSDKHYTSYITYLRLVEDPKWRLPFLIYDKTKLSCFTEDMIKKPTEYLNLQPEKSGWMSYNIGELISNSAISENGMRYVGEVGDGGVIPSVKIPFVMQPNIPSLFTTSRDYYLGTTQETTEYHKTDPRGVEVSLIDYIGKTKSFRIVQKGFDDVRKPFKMSFSDVPDCLDYSKKAKDLKPNTILFDSELKVENVFSDSWNTLKDLYSPVDSDSKRVPMVVMMLRLGDLTTDSTVAETDNLVVPHIRLRTEDIREVEKLSASLFVGGTKIPLYIKPTSFAETSMDESGWVEIKRIASDDTLSSLYFGCPDDFEIISGLDELYLSTKEEELTKRKDIIKSFHDRHGLTTHSTELYKNGFVFVAMTLEKLQEFSTIPVRLMLEYDQPFSSEVNFCVSVDKYSVFLVDISSESEIRDPKLIKDFTNLEPSYIHGDSKLGTTRLYENAMSKIKSHPQRISTTPLELIVADRRIESEEQNMGNLRIDPKTKRVVGHNAEITLSIGLYDAKSYVNRSEWLPRYDGLLDGFDRISIKSKTYPNSLGEYIRIAYNKNILLPQKRDGKEIVSYNGKDYPSSDYDQFNTNTPTFANSDIEYKLFDEIETDIIKKWNEEYSFRKQYNLPMSEFQYKYGGVGIRGESVGTANGYMFIDPVEDTGQFLADIDEKDKPKYTLGSLNTKGMERLFTPSKMCEYREIVDKEKRPLFRNPLWDIKWGVPFVQEGSDSDKMAIVKFLEVCHPSEKDPNKIDYSKLFELSPRYIQSERSVYNVLMLRKPVVGGESEQRLHRYYHVDESTQENENSSDFYNNTHIKEKESL